MDKERRRYPRLSKVLPLKISSQNFEIVTQTKNLSCNGAFCPVNTYLAPMTKLKITLLLPEKQDYLSPKSSKKVSCIGVVVRTEEINHSNYNIAIFFEQMKERERLKLERYIQEHLRV
ncbi:MAG TPA: PilZ domain-containing protein [Candidatus Omnitrophica bacterium]|nr:MAG: hypothetical protein DRP61_03380 [Candidatus Omnitrophota bacterium]RKY43589.1 MAG: hypothetical protein DRP80_04830 [Candidatus Omnitrophota bacterium]HEC69381.1 PilZ domain-containing protein [Candidatus Omnitrophota bacterium]